MEGRNIQMPRHERQVARQPGSCRHHQVTVQAEHCRAALWSFTWELPAESLLPCLLTLPPPTCHCKPASQGPESLGSTAVILLWTCPHSWDFQSLCRRGGCVTLGAADQWGCSAGRLLARFPVVPGADLRSWALGRVPLFQDLGYSGWGCAE